MNRLEAYVFGPPQARHRDDRISLAIAFAWYLISSAFFKKSGDAMLQSVMVLIACQIGSTVIYCLSSRTAPADQLTEFPYRWDRTVAVYGRLDQGVLKSLKREALLFDQIVIPNLDREVSHLSRSSIDELYRLRDLGIVREIRELSVEYYRRYRDEIAARTAEPSDVTDEVGLSRMYSDYLRRVEGVDAFPILSTRRQIGDVFPSGSALILEVLLESLPIPDETPWEAIIRFRNDPEMRRSLRQLHAWVRDFAQATTAKSSAEMKEEIEGLLNDAEHMKLHRMRQTRFAVLGEIAEVLVKFKWRELVKLPVILRELKAPNSELAFISMARSRFST